MNWLVKQARLRYINSDKEPNNCYIGSGNELFEHQDYNGTTVI